MKSSAKRKMFLCIYRSFFPPVQTMPKKYEFIVVFIVAVFLIYTWVSRFGFSLPSLEGYVALFEEDAWFLVFLGLIATASALLSLFLEFKLSRSATFIGWVLYFPVLFNVLLPMFIPFFSVIGVFYTPWLALTDFDFANMLIHGFIRFPNESVQFAVGITGYTLIAAGLVIYSLSLFQLLSHNRKGRTLLTRGFYGVVRHPQYLGIIIWTLGFAISGWRLINYLVWLTLGYLYLVLAEYEESELERTFGQEYLEYKSKVPLIVPYLKLKLFPKIASKRKIRILAYTLTYVTLLIALYHFLNPYVIMYR